MISPIQRVAIAHLASGWSEDRVANELKIAKGQLTKWRKTDPDFSAELSKAVLNHAAIVEALLIAGEREAAETLMGALKAEDRGGRPNWGVRLNAALSLLDRAGQRGRAIEKQQIAQVVARAQPDVEEALRKALRDPGVKSWLKASGSLPQLAAGEQETIGIEVDLDPSNPQVAPLTLVDDGEKIA